ncbi:MAG: transcriptional regulator with PAS, ATPase and Fis domain [Myxococcota bacterium]|jgi:transcriptional regulator with PAS, ATPase and Fis domain
MHLGGEGNTLASEATASAHKAPSAAASPPRDEISPGVPMPIHAAGSPIAGVLALARRVARTDCNVLVTGESGTGKEVIVRALHAWSNRRRGKFVPVNCGAIPENLLESELFGHVRGAFTGADRPRIGRFELAHKGTIFLDEIGELPLMLQVKLLRVIQEHRIEPLGSMETKEVDFRLVAATNVGLEDAVKDNKFREDLYFRLNVLRLHLPPLRQRSMDIAPLVRHFTAMYNDRLLTEVQGFTDGAMRQLERQGWPGNVRELENFVQGLMVLAGEGWISEREVNERLNARHSLSITPGIEERVAVQDSAWVQFPDTGIDLNGRVDEYETHMIRIALSRADGNKTQAARLLGLNRTTLVEKLKRKHL